MARIGIDARRLGDGGIGRYVGELLLRLPRLAPRQSFVALVRPADARPVRRVAPDLEVVALGARPYGVREHFEVDRVARREELDLLHLPHYVFPWSLRCRAVVTVHDLIHWLLPRTPFHRLYCRAMVAAVRRRAARVVVPAESVARDLVERAGFDRSQVRVVPNGVTAPAEGDEDERAVAAFRRRLGLEDAYALNVTNGLPHKGLDVLLEAFRELPGLRLVLVGQGSDRRAVLRQVARSGLGEKRVAVLGGLSERELGLAYRGATVVVIASRLEGFGLPALEAMAYGAPVVTTDAGGLPEVVGAAGLIVPVDSVASLRRALYRVAFETDSEQRRRIVERGRERSRRFSWERTARETLAAYEEALAADAG